MQHDVPLVLAATFGKCFGLYGERVGLLAVVAPDEGNARRIEGQMKLMARAETGAQPAFGARIVEMVLGDGGGCDDEDGSNAVGEGQGGGNVDGKKGREKGQLRKMWEQDVQSMAAQLESRRRLLRSLLEGKRTPGDWSYLTEQQGMFSYVKISFLGPWVARCGFHRQWIRSSYGVELADFTLHWLYLRHRYSTFSTKQIDLLREKHHVYVQETGRISIA